MLVIHVAEILYVSLMVTNVCKEEIPFKISYHCLPFYFYYFRLIMTSHVETRCDFKRILLCNKNKFV